MKEMKPVRSWRQREYGEEDVLELDGVLSPVWYEDDV